MYDTDCVERIKKIASTSSLEEIQYRDHRYVWHPWSPSNHDLARLTLTRGSGYRVWDTSGKEYIDASSLNLSCGYAHPILIAAINQQLLTFHGTDITKGNHALVGLLAERLAKLLPKTLSKTLFVNSGSEGFEAAIFIAASYWKHIGQSRSRIVTFSRGYHGSTLIARSLSGLAEVQHPFMIPIPVDHVEFPVPPRELRCPESLQLLLSAFEKAIYKDKNDLPAAVVVEPFINVGGGVVLPTGFLAGLRRLCDLTGTLLILDEVYTGYGRTGKMFAFQHEEIQPDILVSSKGLASGYMPITSVTVQDYIHETFAKDPILAGLRYGHTTSGHAISCAAALATLDILEKENLSERARVFGKVLLENFDSMTGTNDIIDVRGFGLSLVLEMSSQETALRLQAEAESKGLLVRRNGAVIMVTPPLVIDKKGIDTTIQRLSECLYKN